MKQLDLLKALVRTEGAALKLRLYGVQAYNIEEGDEYNVITEFALFNGRYYFIDRDGKKFLACRYERAEWLAGEFNEQLDRDCEAAQEAAAQVKRTGAAWVRGCILDIFFDVCDIEGLQVESKQSAVDELGHMVTLYVIKDTEPTDETDEAADEIEATETAEETTEQTDERKPSALSSLIAKVSGKAKAAAEAAKKVARKAAFLLAVVVVLALAFLTFGASIIYVLNPITEALNPAGWLRVILGIVFAFTFAIDAAAFVEINCIALISRLFPSMFEGCDNPDFMLPRNMIYWTIKENL